MEIHNLIANNVPKLTKPENIALKTYRILRLILIQFLLALLRFDRFVFQCVWQVLHMKMWAPTHDILLDGVVDKLVLVLGLVSQVKASSFTHKGVQLNPIQSLHRIFLFKTIISSFFNVLVKHYFRIKINPFLYSPIWE